MSDDMTNNDHSSSTVFTTSSAAYVSDPILVDAHAHVWIRDMPMVPGSAYRFEYDFSVAQYLQRLDDHGINFGFLAAASPFGDYNDCTIDALRANRRRLRGSVIVDPDIDRYVLERMAADGVVGVRLPLHAMADLPDLRSFAYRKLFRRVRDLDWHVHVYVDGPRLPGVIAALEESGVKFVVDHFGMPDPKLGLRCNGFQALIRSIEKGRTWVKVSGGYRVGGDRAVEYGRELLRTVGPDRLMWASDCPFAGYENQFSYQHTIDAVRAWLPPGPARDLVFGRNALGLYFA
jgi:predicted TIM-barrel fold metal-dependent hydrolase